MWHIREGITEALRHRGGRSSSPAEATAASLRRRTLPTCSHASLRLWGSPAACCGQAACPVLPCCARQWRHPMLCAYPWHAGHAPGTYRPPRHLPSAPLCVIFTPGAIYKYDVSMPIHAMYQLVEDMRRRLAAAFPQQAAEPPAAAAEDGAPSGGGGSVDGPPIRVAGYGHLGDGNLHLNISGRAVQGPYGPATWPLACRAVQPAMLRCGSRWAIDPHARFLPNIMPCSLVGLPALLPAPATACSPCIRRGSAAPDRAVCVRMDSAGEAPPTRFACLSCWPAQHAPCSACLPSCDPGGMQVTRSHQTRNAQSLRAPGRIPPDPPAHAVAAAAAPRQRQCGARPGSHEGGVHRVQQAAGGSGGDAADQGGP